MVQLIPPIPWSIQYLQYMVQLIPLIPLIPWSIQYLQYHGPFNTFNTWSIQYLQYHVAHSMPSIPWSIQCLQYHGPFNTFNTWSIQYLRYHVVHSIPLKPLPGFLHLYSQLHYVQPPLVPTKQPDNNMFYYVNYNRCIIYEKQSYIYI